MPSLNVLLLCSNPFRAKQLSKILTASKSVSLSVLDRDSDWNQAPPEPNNLDLVICDSLHTNDSIYYLRRLYQHHSFFSVIECEALEASIRWSLAKFRECSGKYALGSYNDLDAVHINELLGKAMLVKRTVKNVSSRSTTDNWTFDSDLSHAINNQQIAPYFQPQVCLKSRKINGVEVLARWRHPLKGLLGPYSFLHLLDSMERQIQLFDCLFQQGLRLQRHLRTHALGDTLAFSYNIEASLLNAPEFAALVLRRIDDAKVLKQWVILEITEREALDLDMQSIENICLLMKHGVRLSLDDFGTGHSSIMRLADIPFSQIKLDVGLIGNAMRIKETRIIEALVGLAKSLNLELVAEGVETEQQRAHLHRLGIRSAQGFLFDKPMKEADLLQRLASDYSIPRVINCKGVQRG
ncbi:EAL domain-containing protein [Pseudomonas sp. UFMG81]|uniref:EAL domain-containing response regulator n=1 Tax=Pseudomonas sp. UFMG81 TaxID=2745936 RepID=UPI00188EA863|nr:EAL domain-containing response regulator [Pseudomonas sp. UFMG81]